MLWCFCRIRATMWFALDGEKTEYEYSYNYQNWYPSVEYETSNTVKNVGLFDLTPFRNLRLNQIRLMKNYKEFVHQILSMKLVSALIHIC